MAAALHLEIFIVRWYGILLAIAVVAALAGHYRSGKTRRGEDYGGRTTTRHVEAMHPSPAATSGPAGKTWTPGQVQAVLHPGQEYPRWGVAPRRADGYGGVLMPCAGPGNTGWRDRETWWRWTRRV